MWLEEGIASYLELFRINLISMWLEEGVTYLDI